MTIFEVDIIINQPVDVVTEALTNPDNFPFWQTDLVKFEVIKGKAGEIGSLGHLHYSQKGKSYILEDKLIQCTPGEKYVSEVTGDALTAQVETLLIASGHKTKMILKWSGKGKVLFLKIILPFIRRKMMRRTKKELEIFKELLETKGNDFSKSPGSSVKQA